MTRHLLFCPIFLTYCSSPAIFFCSQMILSLAVFLLTNDSSQAIFPPHMWLAGIIGYFLFHYLSWLFFSGRNLRREFFFAFFNFFFEILCVRGCGCVEFKHKCGHVYICYMYTRACKIMKSYMPVHKQVDESPPTHTHFTRTHSKTHTREYTRTHTKVYLAFTRTRSHRLNFTLSLSHTHTTCIRDRSLSMPYLCKQMFKETNLHFLRHTLD